MWTWAAESVRGEAHGRNRSPCQDACRVVRLEAPEDDRLVIAVADGAGSASASDLGARAAVDHVASVCSTTRAGSETHLDESVVRRWFVGASAAVGAVAAARRLAVTDLACTLLVAVLDARGGVFGQVGDGAIVIARRGTPGWATVFWPDEGDHPDETTFITSPGYEESLRVQRIGEPVDDVAVFTDGMQRLALDYSRRAAHPPFFSPLFRVLRSEPHGDFSGAFRAFLSSPDVAARTDDDRTLVVAARLLVQ